VEDLSFPYWLKSAFGTAGGGVRLVIDERSREDAERKLLDASAPVLAQEPARGQYAQCRVCLTTGAWWRRTRACRPGRGSALAPRPG
jgi:hypothetical protein